VTRDIDIIIVNHNTRAETEACLASLYGAWPERARGVVVVDNASTDGSIAAVRSRFPGATVLPLDRNAGFGAANNAGLRESIAALVLFLNSDTIVPAGAIDTLAARLEARGVVAAGPKLVDAQGRPEISYGAMLTPWSELRQRWRVRTASSSADFAQWLAGRWVAREREVDWVSGACLLARRQPVVDAGGFDERFFLYEEDVDLCAALRRRGGSILFTPHAQVTHLRGRSVAAAASALDAGPSSYDASHLAFYAKHAPHWVPWLRAWQRLRGRAVR
jgi:GT2 family glycosyltransferase